MKNLGGGVAPWNVQQYQLHTKTPQIVVQSNATGKQWPIIFFHFHGLQLLNNNKVWLAGPLYALKPEVKNIIYKPYVQLLLSMADNIAVNDPHINSNGIKKTAPESWKFFIQFIRSQLQAISKQPAAILHIKNFTFTLHHHIHDLKKWV